MTSGIILAAPASGSGKTVLCAGLLAVYRRQGRAVRAFKAGPDYIDPGYHRLASGHDCVNLDPWGMRPATLARRAAALGAGAELVVGEGAMGLFDGARDGTGSTADLAAWLGLPVVLVVDARGQGASVAALAEGFANHRADVTVAGVILNRVAGAAHERMLRDALEARAIAVLGAVPRAEALSLPSRHLGLVQACEGARSWIDDAAAVVAQAVDTAALAALARPLQAPAATQAAADGAAIPPLGQRIAVARDEAFGFCYDALMADWHGAGAAWRRSRRSRTRRRTRTLTRSTCPAAIRSFTPAASPAPRAFSPACAARAGAGRGTSTANAAATWCWAGASSTPTAGATPWPACCRWRPVLSERRLALGYRQTRLAADGPLGKAGAAFRGHEFHYCRAVSEEAERPLFAACDAAGTPLGHAGMSAGTVAGSFIHLIDRA